MENSLTRTLSAGTATTPSVPGRPPTLRGASKIYTFGLHSIPYLQHTVSPSGLSPVHTEISIISDRLAQANLTELRSFIGLIQYCRVSSLLSFCSGFKSLSSMCQARLIRLIPCHVHLVSNFQLHLMMLRSTHTILLSLILLPLLFRILK